jgi:DNA-binding CsgD family transcriptional regulator
MAGNPAPPNPLAELTGKQREVLDLLIEHKTSKEISRTLGISPHTVDQRINLARGKLGLTSRNQVAQEYRRLVQTYEAQTYERSVYQKSDLAPAAIRFDQSARDKLDSQLALSQTGLAVPGRTTLFKEWDGVDDYRVCPELLDGQWGTYARLGVIAGLALLFAVVILGGLSLFTVASQIMLN